MGKETISRFPVAEFDAVPEDLRRHMLMVQERAGFIPNIFLALAHRPEEFRAFFAYHDALMLRESSGLSKAEREMIVVATSGKNNCLYCVVAHGAILRIYAKDTYIADQISVNYLKAPLSARQQAMLDFAMKVSRSAQDIVEEDFSLLRVHGFSDDDIWDIGMITAFFALSNRMANMISLQPNPEFFMLGRSREKGK